MNGRVETMAGHLHKVTFKEQLIICHVIHEHTDEQRYAHLSPALLPFVPMTVVHSALAAKKASRPIAVIYSKLGAPLVNYLDRIWLDDRKVMKVFGPDPSKGRRFNWLPNHGKPIDKLVTLKFAYKNKNNYQKGGSVYDVIVHKAYFQPVLAWLVDNLT
jgi:hypothetical protein